MIDSQVDNHYFQEVEEIHLRDYIRIILYRKWLVLASFLIVMLAAIYYIHTTPPVYKATVTLSYEDRTASQLVLDELKWNSAQFPIDAEQEFLTSSPVVKDIVDYLTPVGPGDSFDLLILQPTLDEGTEIFKNLMNQRLNIMVDGNESILLPEPIGNISVTDLPPILIIESITEKVHLYNSTAKILLSNPTIVARHKSLVSAGHVANAISLTSPRGSNILYLSASADTPQKAALLANTAAYVYTRQVTERKGKDLDFALGFLRSQMQTVEQLMENTSEALYEFRKEQKLTPGKPNSPEQASLLNQLGSYHAELNNTKDQVEVIEAQLEELNRQIAETRARVQSSSDDLLTTDTLTDEIIRLREAISTLELQKKIKLETVTEKHPDIVSLTRQIEVTQERLDQLLERIKNQKGVTTSSITEWDSLVKESVNLRTRLQGFRKQEQHLIAKIKKFEEEHPDLVSEDLKLMRLERKVRVHDQRYAALLSSQDQMTLMKEMQTSGIAILKQAGVPRSPVKPRKVVTLLLGAALGTIVGIGAALFLEYMDDSIKRKEDVERSLHLEVVGTIPKIPTSHTVQKSLQLPGPQTVHALPVRGQTQPNGDARLANEEGNHSNEQIVSKSRHRHGKGYRKRITQLMSRLVTNLKSQSQVTESYRTLQSNIQFATIDTDVKSFLITSAAPGEGKTLTASNLAITMAWSGKKVLLVDCDLRRPRQHTIFGCPKEPGLSDYLIGNWESEADGSNGLVRRTGLEGLDLVTCGSLPPNPTELLNSKKLIHLIEQWQQEYDFILLDSPPVVSVADASILATKVDRTLLIVKSGQTKRQIAIQARDTLQKANTKIFGVILNDIDLLKQYGYYYYYYYYRNYYSADDEA